MYEGKPVVICPNIKWGDGFFPSDDYTILGLEQHGTFAERLKIKRQNIYPKPAHLNIFQAAALPLAGLTAFRALFTRAGLKQGEKVLISGIGGGVALMACQMALAIGAEVYVTSSSEEKIQKAIALGAKGGANYKDTDQMKRLASDVGGFNVIIDSAGGEGFQTLLKMCKMGARVTVYGGTAGNINNLSVANIFFKQISILGSTMGSDIEFGRMLEFVHHYNIVPIIDTCIDLQHGQEGLDKMADGEQFGKIVMNIS
jgi:NADPH:quinone reductase-like Zn-dependent oxidoreductase